MKKILFLQLLFLILILVQHAAQAQKISRTFLPAKNSETPAWFTVFYEEEFETRVNVFELDKQYQQYCASLKSIENKKELLNSEEGENSYQHFYKRWRRVMDKYILADGKINMKEYQSLEKPFQSSPENLTAAPGNWTLVGPVESFLTTNSDPLQPDWTTQINIYSIAIAPSDPNILYCGAETGGVYKSVDKGLNWNFVTRNYFISSCGAIAIHPTNPSIVYAGTNNMISKSTDGGVTWSNATFSIGWVNSIVVQTSNPNKLFAGGDNGLFLSTNGGVTWSPVAGMSEPCLDILYKTNNNSIIYVLKQVAGYTEFWKSINGGSTFTASMSGWNNKGIATDWGARMSVCPSSPNLIYAVVLGAPPTDVPYLYKSTNSGATWDTLRTGSRDFGGNTSMPFGLSIGQGYYDLDILVNPNNANEILVGTTSAFRSTDGGLTFTGVGGYLGNIPIHPDIQEIVSNGTDTYIATDGGVNFSSDFFATKANFDSRCKGLFGSDFWGFAQGWNEDYIAGGRYHNGNSVLSENYPAGEALLLGGAESATGYYMLGKPGYIAFSDIGGKVAPLTKSGIVKNFNFNNYPNEDGYGAYTSEIEFFPYCYNHIYSGKDNELWKSTDGGISWVSVYNFNERVKEFEVSRNNPNYIYLATEVNLYKTNNGGATWTVVPLPAGCSIQQLSIALSPSSINIFWITSRVNGVGNRVFKTVDGGATWSNLTKPSIDGQSYKKILFQGGTNGSIYIFGEYGKVFYTNNSLPDWIPYNSGLPAITNCEHVALFYKTGKVRIASNTGIWETDFYENKPPVAQPTVDKLTSACFRDTFYFDDFSVLKHAGATWAWSFPGATYVSSTTVRNPKVMYGAIGTYDFGLTVTTPFGSHSKTITGKITITGNLCSPDTVPGKVLTLSNVGDYAEAQKDIAIATNTMTLSCWIKPNGIQPDYAGIIFSGSPNGYGSGMDFYSNNRIGYHWNGDAWWWGGGPILPANKWSHIALVINPDSAVIYHDGIAYVNKLQNPVVNFNIPFQFGIDRNILSRNFNGQMDEICIYNRALSTSEIRQLMNLTRNNPNSGSMPAADPSLLCYYQFNEGSGIPALDKSGLNHTFLAGLANKTAISTAPVGGGWAQTLPIISSGTKNFNVPAVEITCAAGSTFPNGDVVVTRLNVSPDTKPCVNMLPNNPASYFIIRNYGTNSTFSPLTSIKLKRIKNVTTAMVSNPSTLSLSKRQINDDGATWNSIAGIPSQVTKSANTGTITFGAGASITSFGQFSICNNPVPLPIAGNFDFTAKAVNNSSVALDWKDIQDHAVKKYEVERSSDGIDYMNIGKVTPSYENELTFTDVQPLNGENYYRLKMYFDEMGYEYSENRMVNFNTLQPEVHILNNPSSDNWISYLFKNVNGSDKVSITVMNEAGQLITSTTTSSIENNSAYHVKVPKGVYLVRFEFVSGEIILKKVVLTD